MAGYLGITPPIDDSEPSDADQACSEALVQTLKSFGVYESDAGQAARRRLVADLEHEAQEWCADEWALQGGSRDDAPRCELRTFGSVRLDVHAPDADVDVVLVAPRHCTRNAFFERLARRLERRPDVGPGRVMPVRDAYTPVVKLRAGSTDVDLLFAPLQRAALPEPLDVMDDAILEGLDDFAVRSLNGARVAELLLKLVPDVAAFKVALRAVKRWARQKGLYSNVLGLLGGVNCAILVAFVCQRFPKAAPSTVVAKFFRVFDAWDWPNPVVLTPPSAEDARAWNPRLNPRDRAHLAPIVTPAHPTMNSSYNVGEPQLRAIRSELGLGMHATRRVEQLARSGATPRQLRKAWRKLFAPSDFFVDYRHYVQVDVSAADDDALRRWTAWCESRLRNLVVALDSPGHVKARVYALPLEREALVVSADDADDGAEPRRVKKTRSFFVALAFEQHVQHIDLTPCVREFSTRVNSWAHRAPGMDLELTHTPQKNLPEDCLPARDASDDDGSASAPSDGEGDDGSEEAASAAIPARDAASDEPSDGRAVDGDDGPATDDDVSDGPPKPLSWAERLKRSAEPTAKRMCTS